MADWREKFGKFFTGKGAKKRLLKEQGKEETFERDESKMSDREKAYREAYAKDDERKKRFDEAMSGYKKYADGGTKFEKLKKKLKKKK